MKRTFYVFILFALLLSACATRQQASAPAPDVYLYDAGGGADGVYAEERMTRPEAPPPSAPMEAPLSESDSALPDAQERLVIQNADLAVVVADPKAKMTQITQLAESLGGYVVSTYMYMTTAPNGAEVPEGSVTVRVPAEKLEEALEQIKADAIEVQSENRSGQDVTAEYVDLGSRLKTHEEAAAQLSEILSQKTESAEVLEVFNQLTYHREQIEIIKGQMKYYEEAAALSAISVRLIAEESIQPIEIGGWKPQGAARDAIQRLVYFLQDFVDFAIRFFLYYLWVILLAVALPVYLVFLGVRAVVRRRRKSKKVVAAPPEE